MQQARKYKKKINRKNPSIEINEVQSLKTYVNHKLMLDKSVRKSMITAFFILLIALCVKTYTMTSNIHQQKKRLEELSTEKYSLELVRDDYKKKLEDSIDLEEIKRYAFESLGMKNAPDDKVIKIDVDK